LTESRIEHRHLSSFCRPITDEIWNVMFLQGSPIVIDIGSSSVKLMEVRKKGSATKLLGFDAELLPEHAVVDGEIANQDAVSAAISSILDRQKINPKGRQAMLTISGGSTIVRRMNTVVYNETDIAEQLYDEAKQIFHHDMEDMYFRYAPIESKLLMNNNERAYIIVAARVGLIENYVQVIKDLKLKVSVIDCDILCLTNLYNEIYEVSEGLNILMNIGASKTQMAFTYEGEFIFNREFQLGGQVFTDAISSQLDVNRENAENMKISASNGDANAISYVKPAINEPIEQFVNEINSTVAFFKQNEDISQNLGAINSVYVSGGAASTIGLAQSISAGIHVPVRLLNPFQAFTLDSSKLDVQSMVNQSPLFAVASGLALRVSKK